MRKEKYLHTDSVNREILNKGKEVIKDFDASQEMLIEPKQLKSKLISIRLPMAMISNLRIIAREKGDIGYQQIIKTYIAEGLIRDNQTIKYNMPQAQIVFESNVSSSFSMNLPFDNSVTGIAGLMLK